MTQPIYQADPDKTRELLFNLLTGQIPDEQQSWLDQKLRQLAGHFTTKDFYLAFSIVSRKIEHQPLKLTKEQLQQADSLRKGFSPENFSTDQAARILLVMTIPHENPEGYLAILNNLFSTGAVNELVALYSGLPLYPYPDALKDRASEGVRTNMTNVFDAIALNNPYPADFMDENAWNQMVLKAVFMERPLDKVIGIDQRANENLARMLSDYAHERWAAKRYVTPELWRPVGPYIDERLLEDIKKLYTNGSEIEQQAAALVSYESNFEEAKNLLDEFPQLKERVKAKEITWTKICENWYAGKAPV